jgi:hypothetical protein
MSIPWKQSLALGLALSLVASPALAGGRHKGHGRHGHHGQHSAYRAHGYGPPRHYYHHHHHHGHGDDLALALGLTAVGVTAFALWAAATPPPVYGGVVVAPAPEPVAWNDPDVTVLSEGTLDTGEFCREFQKEIVVGGRVERGWGIACLMEDGSWRIGR